MENSGNSGQKQFSTEIFYHLLYAFCHFQKANMPKYISANRRNVRYKKINNVICTTYTYLLSFQGRFRIQFLCQLLEIRWYLEIFSGNLNPEFLESEFLTGGKCQSLILQWIVIWCMRPQWVSMSYKECQKVRVSM